LNRISRKQVPVSDLRNCSITELYYYIPLCFAMFKDQTELGEEFFMFLHDAMNNRTDNSVRYLIFWLSKIKLVHENEFTFKTFGKCTHDL